MFTRRTATLQVAANRSPLTPASVRRMRVHGHRGTPTDSLTTENTLDALRRALDDGADGVEVDVRATADGVLVLAHDPDLGRVLCTGEGTGPVVADTSFHDLRSCVLPGGARIPRVSEALDLMAHRGAHVVLEVKPDAGARRLRTARLLADLLDRRRRARAGDRVTTSSFDPLTAAVLAGHGTVGAAVIVEPYEDAEPAALQAWAAGLTELHLSLEHVRRDPAVVVRLHALGLTVAAGIVDDPEEAHELQRLGVDMLCSDAPAAVVDGLRMVAPA